MKILLVPVILAVGVVSARADDDYRQRSEAFNNSFMLQQEIKKQAEETRKAMRSTSSSIATTSAPATEEEQRLREESIRLDNELKRQEIEKAERLKNGAVKIGSTRGSIKTSSSQNQQSIGIVPGESRLPQRESSSALTAEQVRDLLVKTFPESAIPGSPLNLEADKIYQQMRAEQNPTLNDPATLLRIYTQAAANLAARQAAGQ